jgi:hypothetical protein
MTRRVIEAKEPISQLMKELHQDLFATSLMSESGVENLDQQQRFVDTQASRSPLKYRHFRPFDVNLHHVYTVDANLGDQSIKRREPDIDYFLCLDARISEVAKRIVSRMNTLCDSQTPDPFNVR